MGRRIIGVLLGAAVYFVWQALSWTVLPLHSGTIKTLPEERLLRDTMRVVVPEPGLYAFPSHSSPDGPLDEKTWRGLYRIGPVGFMAYRPHGGEPMSAATFAFGALADVGCAVIVMGLLWTSRGTIRGPGARSAFMAAVGLLVWLAAHVPYWIWFSFPFDYTIAMLVDSVVPFALMGLVMSKWVGD